MCRLCWFLTLILAGCTVVLVYLFVIQGAVVPSRDGRSAIMLDPGERDLVLTEMRGFLVAVQAITAAAAENDVATVVSAARGMGVSTQTEVPATLVGKLPLAFKQMGFATHKAFDQLAMNTEAFGDTQAVPAALGELLQQCTACHAAYQLTSERP